MRVTVIAQNAIGSQGEIPIPPPISWCGDDGDSRATLSHAEIRSVIARSQHFVRDREIPALRCLSSYGQRARYTMKRLIAMLALAGALWMALVINRGWVFLAFKTNYLGMLAGRLVECRGIAPSLTTVWIFNVWLVVTSALECVILGLLVRSMIGRFHGLRR